MRRFRCFPLLAIAVMIPVQAHAAPEGGQPPVAAPTTNCSPTGESRQQKPLSDKLAESRGVICPPPALDPQMQKRPPGGGSIEVVPPPGSPGGNPDVQPK